MFTNTNRMPLRQLSRCCRAGIDFPFLYIYNHRLPSLYYHCLSPSPLTDSPLVKQPPLNPHVPRQAPTIQSSPQLLPTSHPLTTFHSKAAFRSRWYILSLKRRVEDYVNGDIRMVQDRRAGTSFYSKI